MSGFFVLDHTADTGIVATGKNLREAFENAAAGLFNIICEIDSLRIKKSFKIKLEGENLDELLIRWLNQLLFLHETEKVVLGHFKILELTEKKLVATVEGESIDLNRHNIKTYVKAATYHDLVVESGEPAKVQVIFDV